MEKRHFLVVGGTKGIGRIVVKQLLQNEANHVSLLGRSAQIDLQSPRLTLHTVDVVDHAALTACLDHAVSLYGPVSNAVFMQRHRGGPDEFETDLAVALGATRCTIEHLLQQQYFAKTASTNSIVMVSSVADYYVAPEQSLGYHVSKAGLVQLARYYALTLGPVGVRVNSVSPCMVAKEEAREFYDRNPALVERYKKYIPLGRMGKSEDIADAVLFLSGDQASYITGQNIVVDGGLGLRTHQSLIRDMP